MGRKPSENSMHKRIMIRMGYKLYDQLNRYSKKNDGSMPSVSARKAIEKMLKENE